MINYQTRDFQSIYQSLNINKSIKHLETQVMLLLYNFVVVTIITWLRLQLIYLLTIRKNKDILEKSNK